MKIIYLSRNMGEYPSAHYQQDVMDEFDKQHETYFYGPGYDFYDPQDCISDVIKKSGFARPDMVVIGHAWLRDLPGADVDPHPNLRLNESDIPKALILNKEYTNLEKKLDFIRKNAITVAFTHHHDAPLYEKSTGIPFIFWPFAVNTSLFRDYGLGKKFDLIFTGILRNMALPHTQSDIRIRLQKKLFFTVDDLVLLKKLKYWKVRIFWQIYSTKELAKTINKKLNRERNLSKYEYSKVMSQSKICLCTLSPLNLVSPRYYEAMASRTLVLCEETDVYQGLFTPGTHAVSFKPDLSDFDEKLNYYIDKPAEREMITENAYNLVTQKHTWEKRVQDLVTIVSERIQQ